MLVVLNVTPAQEIPFPLQNIKPIFMKFPPLLFVFSQAPVWAYEIIFLMTGSSG